MRACMIFETLKLIPGRKNRESYEENNKLIFVLEKLNTKWTWSRFGPKFFFFNIDYFNVSENWQPISVHHSLSFKRITELTTFYYVKT